jgi:hypothetical protein
VNEQDTILPPELPGVPHGATVALQQNRARSMRFGFPDEVYVASTPDSAFAWDSLGNMLAACGAPALVLATLASGASVVTSVGQSAPAAPAADALPPSPEPVLAPDQPMPSDGEAPLHFITRATDATRLQAWVLGHGVTGPHAVAWAHFAQAMGWELPVTESTPSETTPQAAGGVG